MYPHPGAQMAPSQKPETFMLSTEAQQSLPHDAQVALQQVDNLKYFLLSAPVDWQQDQLIRRFLLPTGDYVSCILWSNLFHVSGTDIVRCLAFRFQAFGRPVKNSKKFEEGIFSDLRNLKAGTDATLEEPKSAFLDFLYKNNCIRTQKKQKVFYWYSVPHDRLFLDALERDLKREKMNQEATTVAVSEPALSFEFDSSQSLYEQLTKSQQANSSSFAPHASTTYGQPNSPPVRTVDAMPPPQMAPPTIPLLQEDNGPHPMYNHQQAVPLSNNLVQGVIKRENDYASVQYDRNGMLRQPSRHSSMPAYYEYSPAPSFVSSHFEDYSNRGLSFEPVTPPQHAVGITAEPAYIANEETGLYSAIPDVSNGTAFHPMMQLPHSNHPSASYHSTPPRSFSATQYPQIEGSPTYKQRRRKPSMTPSGTVSSNTAHMQSTAPQPQPISYAAHRPSDLRRSISTSVPRGTEDESGHDLSQTYPSAMLPQKDLLQDMPRLGTPLQGMDQSTGHHPSSLASHSDNLAVQDPGRSERSAPGPIRRARSATMMELGPYSQKSHSCPIPSCGRVFKRLEHLKRHVRTHTQERPYPCPYCSKAFSRSDNLAQHRRIHEAQHDGQSIGPIDDDLEGEEYISDEEIAELSPIESHAMINMPHVPPGSAPISLPSTMSGMGGQHMIAPQLLQQHM